MVITRIIGTFLHTPSEDHKKLDVKLNYALEFDSNGKIITFAPKDSIPHHTEEVKEIVLKPTQFVIPGFVDTHAHAPQFLFAGLGQDLPLMEWLQKYTFPTESNFTDLSLANNVYSKFVKSLLACGTTTACVFATIHKEASLKLAEICADAGLRTLVGKVSMDRNSPDFYVEQTEKSIEDNEWFIQKVLALNETRIPESKNFAVKPIITPRFVPTCTPKLLIALGDLAKKYHLSIQSHVSENLSEIDFVNFLHPECKNYVDVYEKYNCMLSTDDKELENYPGGGKTILAHGVWCTDAEMEALAKTNSTVSHCPLSNFSLSSGTMNINKHWAKGVHVSLGTDVAGGYSPSMLNAIRNTMICSTSVAFNERVKDPSFKRLNFEEMFYLATLGGAKGLNLDMLTGNFETGKFFDAQIIDVEKTNSFMSSFSDVFQKHLLKGFEQSEDGFYREMLQKYVFCGDDRNISELYVSGKRIAL